LGSAHIKAAPKMFVKSADRAMEFMRDPLGIGHLVGAKN